MDNVTTLLVAAVAALATAVVQLYRDRSKADAKVAAAEKAHGENIQILTREWRAAAEGAMTAAGGKFAAVVTAITEQHHEQEESIHEAHRAQIDAFVREHKAEIAGMVDRVVAAFQNAKEHDDMVTSRVLDLAESMKRVAESSGKVAG